MKKTAIYSILLLVSMLCIQCRSIKETIEPEAESNMVLNMKPDLNKIPNAKLSPTDLSSKLLNHIRKDKDVTELFEILKNLPEDSLTSYLDADYKKLCFWVNMYNVHSLYLLKTDPSLYLEDRSAFFGKDQVVIAGTTMSLEDIEHGILRKGATVWTTGYLRLPFRNKLVRNYAVDQVDYRIHFALNCGAKSCPPIATYYEDLVDLQLSVATTKHLKNNVEIESEVAKVPAFMKWFLADFQGKKGIRQILSEVDLIEAESKIAIEGSPYDWTMDINNFAEY